MDDIEFVAAAADGSGDDDVIALGARRRVPRWLALTVAVALATLVVVALALSTDEHRTVAGSPPASSAAPSTFTGVPVTDPADAVLDGNRLIAYSQDRIAIYVYAGLGTPDIGPATSVGGLDFTQRDASHHLVLDASHDRLWLVSFDAVPTLVIEFDLRTLTERGRFTFPAPASGAAALDGRLFVATSTGVAELSPDAAQLTAVPDLRGALVVTADPSRHRLLLIDNDGPARIWLYTPGRGTTTAGTVLPFSTGDLRVAGGQIWVGGFGTGAVLVRLDPRTLKPVLHSRLEAVLGPGAILAAAGAHDLFVRDGSGGDGLWCIDGNSGAVREMWQVAGRIVSGPGTVFVVAPSGEMTALPLGACRA